MNAIEVKRRLTESGIDPGHAEALAEELGHLAETQLATKEDLEALRLKIRKELGWWALGIVGTNLAGFAAILSAFGA